MGNLGKKQPYRVDIDAEAAGMETCNDKVVYARTYVVSAQTIFGVLWQARVE